jgi:hypothetical protein
MTLWEIGAETLFYSVLTLIVATALLAIVALALLAHGLIAGAKGQLNVLRRFALILGAVVVLGFPADFLWILLFPGRWYVDKDHVFGFSPLLPFRLDTQCGAHFIGHGSYLAIEAAWLLFAAAVWLAGVELARKLDVRFFRTP